VCKHFMHNFSVELILKSSRKKRAWDKNNPELFKGMAY